MHCSPHLMSSLTGIAVPAVRKRDVSHCYCVHAAPSEAGDCVLGCNAEGTMEGLR